MNQFKKVIVSLCFIVIFSLQSNAFASAPYITETLSPDGNLIETQTAFKPLGQFLQNAEIVAPEDIYADKKGRIYIADSGNKQVVVVNLDGTVKKLIGKNVLDLPTGVFVDEEGDIFVADYGKEKVFRFSNEGELKGDYGRPESPLFGKTSPYKPQKVGIDRRGNIYVIGEGSTNGIIQLSNKGEFLGYYGVNSTEVSFSSFVKNLLTSEQQKAGMFLKTPPAPDNIALDERGLIYSITEGTETEVIKKLNVAGKNILSADIMAANNLQDISIDTDGNIFVVTSAGLIAEYDSFGNLLFLFGGTDDGSNRLGLFKQPTGVAIDENGRLYVSDKERGMIQVFEATAFANKVHEGIGLFKEGLYVQSQKYWESVLELNSSFGLAHTAMGRAYYKQQDYEKSLEEFRFAEDVSGYSDAFWEVRHAWMQKYLGSFFGGLIAATVIYFLLKYMNGKTAFLEKPIDRIRSIRRIRLINELLFLFQFFKHPIDSFYYLKRKKYASVLSATIFYMVLFIEYLISKFQTGFIFTSLNVSETNLGAEATKLIVPILLFIIVNYLVSTINDGEGRFKDIYIGTIYSLAPYIVFILPIVLISNVLTLNESFIYDFAIRIVYAWCLMILTIMIKEIHNYTFSETVRNIFITLFGMAIMILVIFIVFVLFGQVYDFVYSIIKEAMLRV
ncbi:YIP1 family protein [Mesobacillus subterraneus]|uniref:Yip1 domain-containing protein n=1 Tax=Mesobacillus subterraneus TaxID=285983 RepID=A0A0D6ZEK9_9BACI|nr:YIP1 family protein [Mesobacillus subterraneus]KIY23521.1 hypothetical protein UB32_02460 [Mesobacillus subterraneus]